MVLSQSYADGTIKKDDFEKQKIKIQQDSQNQQIFLATSYQKDATALEQKATDEQIKINEDGNAKMLDDDKKTSDQKKALQEAGNQFGKDLVSAAFTFEKNANDKALAQAQATHDAEIAALKNKGYSQAGLAAATAASDKKFKDESDRLKRQQAQADKELALFNIALNTATAVTKQTGGLPLTAPLIAYAIAEGVLQAAIVAARPMPAFYKGVIDLPLGNNKRGRDTIPAMLHEGESVMTADETKRFKPILLAMRSGALDKVPLNWAH